MRRVHAEYPDKTVWCYTGYDYEKDILGGYLGNWDITRELLSYIDILVDGEFHQDEKDLTLRFKGSRNQRIIDLKASIPADSVILWDPDTEAEN